MHTTAGEHTHIEVARGLGHLGVSLVRTSTSLGDFHAVRKDHAHSSCVVTCPQYTVGGALHRGWSWRWQTPESSRPDWSEPSEPLWQCVPLALAVAAPTVRRGLLLGRYERHVRGAAAALHCHWCCGCHECAAHAGCSGCAFSCCGCGRSARLGGDIVRS